ncbi:MAG: leucine-rich repeat domain-containing protein [Alkalinema sp. RU_4_3]|nr:leucine-rich repeat domain-containing protein [Alkalinema sp. RU_4_3]
MFGTIRFSVFPESIAQLTNLTKLNLSKNKISEIPEWISSLANLTELYLSENQITVMPRVCQGFCVRAEIK